jgi:hypothetical protein
VNRTTRVRYNNNTYQRLYSKEEDEKRLEAAEMRFMCRTAGYTILDKKREMNTFWKNCK